MAFSPRNKETDRLAGEAAALSAETLTDAVRKPLADQVMAIAHEFSALPDFDMGSPDDIIGYDVTGSWR